MAGHDRNRSDDGELRGDGWFAKQLGDGWQAVGDGIYTYVGESSEPAADEQSPEPDQVDEVAPARETQRDQNLVPEPRHGRRWLRR